MTQWEIWLYDVDSPFAFLHALKYNDSDTGVVTTMRT
jgi:hypothetical protein